jgi:alpha-N-arabinofuranosidase
MANIAQVANVLQSMVLTQGDKMVLTPTYHTFRMYNVHQEATFLPLICNSKTFTDANGRECPIVDATASRNAEGVINVTLTNTDLENAAEITISIASDKKPAATGEILTSANIGDYNDFDSPEKVTPVEFKEFKVKDGKIIVKMPAKSIVSLCIR